MKSNMNPIVAVSLGLVLSLGLSSSMLDQNRAAGATSLLWQSKPAATKPEAPKTTAEKLGLEEKRYNEALGEISNVLRKLPTETSLLGSKRTNLMNVKLCGIHIRTQRTGDTCEYAEREK